MADIITYGGGFGASKHDNSSWNASEGGSGGGGSGGRASSSSYGGLAANGLSGQGYAGSNSYVTWYPGGGGGANAIGANNPANGGNGIYSTILGANGSYANGFWFGGGGGGAGYSAKAGNGGLGGGGGGAPFVSDGGYGGLGGVNNGSNSYPGSLNSQTNVPGGAGGNNTGGGGGGGSHYNSNNPGGAGGSGVVIFRYQIPNKPTQVTVNPTNAAITLNQYITNPNYIPVTTVPGYGNAPFTYTTSSALPSGLSISSSNGAILGQPTVNTTNVPYTVIVTDSTGASASANFTLTTSNIYYYALDVNTTSMNINVQYGLTTANTIPAQIGGNTEVQITSYAGPTNLKYDTSPVATIPVMASQVYGYNAMNTTTIEVDSSFNNYLDLDDKLRTIYGCVNANVSGYFLSSQQYTTPGTYNWTVPNGVSKISVVGVGGGGAGSQKAEGGTGGGGGQLKYVNNVSVTPGQVYEVVVGAGGITGGNYGNSGEYTTMTLVSNGNIILSAAGGAGGDRLYWTANTSQITAQDANANLFTFQAGISGGQTITYSVSNGSLPTGASFNTTTGVLSWTRQSIANTTTYPQFTISASAANQIINSPVTLTITPVTFGFNISPAVSGKSTWYPAADGPLALTTQGTWTVTPIANFVANVAMWGGGGGSVSYGADAYGGAGGATTGKIQFANGVAMTFIVGGGGGGGAANRNAAGGGAGTGIEFAANSSSIMVAGGGGGGYGGPGRRAGAGGGTNGQNADPGGGYGGTQTAAGAGGSSSRRTGASGVGRNGGQGGTGSLAFPGGIGYGNGGFGSYNGGDAGSGGGGGGYWGGGEGGGDAGGFAGGAGSGYFNTGVVTLGNTVAGNYQNVALSSDFRRGNAGTPGVNGTSGANGKIYLNID